MSRSQKLEGQHYSSVFFYHDWSTYPKAKIKGSQWLVSPDHKALCLGGGRVTSQDFSRFLTRFGLATGCHVTWFHTTTRTDFLPQGLQKRFPGPTKSCFRQIFFSRTGGWEGPFRDVDSSAIWEAEWLLGGKCLEDHPRTRQGLGIPPNL